jgi:hypothetical protein
MSIDFPNSPSPNQTYVFGNITWVWNGSAWDKVSTSTGYLGATGPQGIQGNTGATGEQGIQGVQGNTGATGPQGIQGVQGNTGATGEQGIQGVQGNTGATGPQGATGSTPTIPIASDSITGVASFNSTNFSVSATGNVSITTVSGGTF